MSRRMPRQKPGRSEQTVCTPPEFLAAIRGRFGVIAWDLAATPENRVAPLHLGPGSQHGEDALAVDWALLDCAGGQNMFSNPPHGQSRLWVKKAAEMRPALVKPAILLLPASVATNWYAEHVHGKALALPLRPRLTFMGHEHPYPKDLMAAVYGRWVEPGFSPWRWLEDESPF